ncbi:MAG: SpoIIE family protein phosphatase [Acidobacteriaceae bacterium]
MTQASGKTRKTSLSASGADAGSEDQLTQSSLSTEPTSPDASSSEAEVHNGEHSLSFEGDYRPTGNAPAKTAVRVAPIQLDFLMQLAEALNTTLDLQTLMHRVADLVRAVIDYRIFAILLINDRTQEMWMRFQIGHLPEIERMRIKLGQGVVGEAALKRKAVLVQDVRAEKNYIEANPAVRSELAVPLISKNKVIGVIDIESEELGYFTQEHQHLLELTASRMAIAIENARLYTRISRQAQTLGVLNDISRELTSILDLDDLLERIGQLMKRVIDFQMFTILLLNERTQRLEHRFSTRYGERVSIDRVVQLGVGVIGIAAQERMPILVPDVRKDERYILLNPETRCELSVPLIYKGKVIGVLDLEHTRTNYFNEEHVRTLGTLAAQIAISVENARLYQRVAEEEHRLERDLAMARQVQLRLLPPTAPKHEHAELAAKFIPARTIGGDMYDFIDYTPDNGTARTAIAVGDVSGKAAPAALYAALVNGIMRSLAQQELSPAQMLSELNEALQERKLDSQYVTMLYAVWNDQNQTLQIANAGSVQPLFVRSGEVETIQAEGFPLGLFPDTKYEEFTLSTQPGDSIVFFSDGIEDAENAEGEMFGSDRLAAVLRQNRKASAKEMVEAILKAVNDFQDGVEHFDDETIVVLRVLGEKA